MPLIPSAGVSCAHRGNRMPGIRLKPRVPLSPFIDCLWYWEGVPGPHRQERLMPQAQSAIIFNLREDPIAVYEDHRGRGTYGTAVFTGARSTCFTIDCNQQERVVGIQFGSGGAAPFFSIPVSEMEDGSFDLRDLWGRDADSIRSRVLASPTPRGMLHALEACLLERITLGRLQPAIAWMAAALDGHHSPRIQEVAEQIGLSRRRLTQLFHEQVGVSPKTFQRVRRFQHTLTRLHGLRTVDWAEVALISGYYDQAHMANDFRNIAGMTPSAYLAAATAHLNHVPLAE